MAGRIPRNFIEDLVSRADIVDLIDSRVPLKRGGKNYMACCPFHKEKTPSFTVTPQKQFYYCFGCGAHGNALSFLMDYDRMGFVEAVEYLAQKVGVEVPYEDSPNFRPRKDYSATIKALESANKFYQQQLRSHPQKKAAVDYLKGRGITGKIAKIFELGYAPPGWDNLIIQFKKEDISNAKAEAAGLVISKENGRQYDRFRDRIMFPIRNKKGQTIAFGGRVLGDAKPKYLNSPETEVFHKSQELYGLYESLQLGAPNQFLIVEGYMDVIALNQFGIHNVVATLGTATGEAHLEKLFKIVKEVVFCFDGDEAGHRAAWRALENSLPLVQEGRQIKFLFLPDGEDPDSLVRKEGTELFQHRVSEAVSLSDYILNSLSQELDLNSIDGRAQLISDAIPLLNKMPNNLVRQMLLQELGKITEIETHLIEAKLTQPKSETAKKKSPAGAANPTPTEVTDYPGVNPDFHPPADYPEHNNVPADYGFIPDESSPDNSYFDEAIDALPNFGAKPIRRKKREQGRAFPNKPSIPLIEALIRALLQSPNLAKQTDLGFDLEELELPLTELLKEIVDIFKSDPEQSLPTLFGLWHNTDRGQQLADIAAKEFLIEETQTEQEFIDGLRKLHDIYFDSALEQEINTPNPNGERIKELLQLKGSFKNPETV